jgi:transcriptional regulator with XRE-family HTH domain
MPKSTPRAHREILTTLLKEVRLSKGLTQTQVAQRLQKPQNYISNYEQGERRLDVLELRDVCQAMGTTLTQIVRKLELRLKNEVSAVRKRK